MLTIRMTFPAGRYHATPWGKHVNEGAVEIPPSPLRLCRALLAVWHRKLPEIDEQTVRVIVDALAHPPLIRLPKASSGHTRHYMPKYKEVKSDKVFDTFAIIARDDPLVLHWPDMELDEGTLTSLKALLEAMTYFGRAESWVDAVVDIKSLEEKLDCVPLLAEEQSVGAVTSVLCPMLSPEYEEWRASQTERLETRLLAEKLRKAQEKGKPTAKVNLTKKDKEKIAATVPEDVFACLSMDTADFRSLGWAKPPGIREVRYALPENATSRAFVTTEIKTKDTFPTLARFALASDTVQGDVRPLLTKALFLAETTRQALMSRARDAKGQTSAFFAGKDDDGRPLVGHRHAYVLPCDDDNDGRIDHILIYARHGFREREQLALTKMRRLWQHKGAPDLFPVLVGLGTLEDFESISDFASLPYLGPAKTWISRTPFLLTRHPKKSGKDSVEHQIRTELGRLNFPEPISVEPAENGTRTQRKLLRWTEFARIRKQGGGSLASTQGYGVKINFAEPVRGPIAIGYGSHFGLGAFICE